MELKTLTISGFKSFADKTVIDFSHGLTGIVGPNGSGKSNITEAIRWAMGEQSAKSLRGGKMPDIIFAGSDLRKPLNRAEVTLVFDNSDQYIANQMDAVSVTRRLFRTGESDFFINDKHCRLKDIIDLFMDSGLGRESFSIISQGRVEAIFNSKPEERRSIIEEAAGVLKYKTRKKQAETQLSTTDDNLSRVADIIYELKDQVEPLKEQSSLAKDYLIQKADFDRYQKEVYVAEIQTFVEEKASSETEAKKVSTSLDRLKREITTLEIEQQEKSQTQQQIDQETEENRQKLLRNTKELERLRGQKEVSAQRQNYSDQTIQNLINEGAELTRKIEEAEQLRAALDTQTKAKKVAVRALSDQLATVTQSSGQTVESLQSEIEDIREQYVQLMQDAATTTNAISSTATQIEKNQQQENRQVTQSASFEQKKVTANAEIAQLTINRDETLQQVNQFKVNQDSQNKVISQKTQQLELGKQAWYKALGILQNAKAKKQSLEDLKEDYAGFYNGVKQVLKHKNQLQGVVGAIAELVTVPKQYQVAIEMAFAGQLQYIVTQDEQAAKGAINYLKQQRAGRATFLPQSTIHPRFLNSQQQEIVDQTQGAHGVAAALVNFDQAQKSIIENIMGTTVIVDNMDIGIQLSRQLHQAIRIVTLEGDLLNPGGSMTGGGMSKRNDQGLIQRQQTIAELAQTIAKMDQDSKQQQDWLQQLEIEIANTHQQIDQQASVLGGLQQNLQEANQLLAVAQSKLDQLIREGQAIAFTAKQQHAEKAEALKKAEVLAATKLQNEAQLTTIKAELEQKSQYLADFAKNQAALTSQRQEIETKLAVQNSELKQLVLTLHDKKTIVLNLRAELTEQQGQLNQLQEGLKHDQLTVAETEEKVKVLTQQITDIEAQYGVLRENKVDVQSRLTELNAMLTRDHQQSNGLMEEQEGLAVNLKRLSVSIDQRLQALSEDYQLTFEAAQADFAKETLDITAVKSKLKLAKMSLTDLGDVNLGSIDEYKRVAERYDFLTKQQTDLLAAKDQLTSTMDEMDTEVATRFNTVFEATAAAFAEIFPLMFGGGHAALTLTDPTDLLGSGIEIIAQPPGKKLQQLSLLSGGERSLTAITLLFAILKVRPVPFCILDEVEAALDEANVARFSQFLKKFDQQTQFIVITHRKGTMVAANVLYGVTMEESGVSKMVSVSLSEIEKTA